MPNICDKLSKEAKKCCNAKTITRKFPVLTWLPKYKLRYLLPDFISGLTVGLTTVPQSLAYGVVAGLEPQYGLYTAFMGGFGYMIFGTCKDVVLATTAISALMVQRHAILNPDYAVFICFFVGLVVLLMGLLNLGVFVRFISVPVIAGFTIGCTVHVASAQINNILGIPSKSSQLFSSWNHLFTHISSTRLNDAVLGIGTLIFLLVLKKAKDMPFGHKLIWKYVSLSRNAVAVIFGAFIAYNLSTPNGPDAFRLTGNITGGLPPLQFPPFSTQVNGTVVTFSEMMDTVKSSVLAISLVSVLEVVSVAKAIAKGTVVDASQEMVCLGMCDIMSSFVSSMPIAGSFTRSVINNASGVKTTLGGVFTGTLVLMALGFLTPAFYYIPKATLSSVIIAAMIAISSAEGAKVVAIWKSKKLDLIPFFVSLLACIFWSLEFGILCGVATNLFIVLYHSAKPHIKVSIKPFNNYKIGFFDIKQRLDFASAEYLKEKVVAYVNEHRDIQLVIINGQEINSIDSTVGMNIVALKEDLEVLNCDLICLNWNTVSAGVICRLNNNLHEIFRFNTNVDNVISDYYEKSSNSIRIASNTTLCNTKV